MVGNFLSAILGFIIDLVFWVCSVVITVILIPFEIVLNGAFPSLGEALGGLATYLDTNFFPIVTFIRDVFLGVTCTPLWIFKAVVGILFFKYAIIPLIRAIIAFIHFWKFLKTGEADITKH